MAKQTTKKVIADLQRENAKLRARLKELEDLLDIIVNDNDFIDSIDLGDYYETKLR